MTVAARIAIIFVAHAFFMFLAYGSHFFGLQLPYGVILVVWLGLPSALAAYAYHSAMDKLKTSLLQVVGTVTATCASLFIGVYFAFNTYGT
jgi:hypothetical protein